jgi:cysteine synthase B
MGTARRLKAYNPAVRAISLQPDSPFNGLEGLKHLESAIQPGIYDGRLADLNLAISTEATYAMARRLAQEEGMLVGISAATAMVGSLKVAEGSAARGEAATIVTVFPDNAYKYLSHAPWSD